MPPPSRRRSAGAPDAATLAELTGAGPLPKAPAVDPVLGAPPAAQPAPERSPALGVEVMPGRGVPASPQQRAVDAAVDRGLVESPIAPGTVTAAAPAVATSPAGAREKSTFYDTPAGLARARAAYLNSHVAEGERSWAEFVAGAVRREVERREAAYNGGRSWAPVGSGQLPTGRPLGG